MKCQLRSKDLGIWSPSVVMTLAGCAERMQAPPLINMVYDQLDLHALGGTQWGWTPAWDPVTKDGWNEEDYSVVDQNLNMRTNYAIRPYARAVAGTPGPFLVWRPATYKTTHPALCMPVFVLAPGAFCSTT